ncbi:phage-related baseplate assembly protein [Acetobacter aceti NRIC 0242]|uniref:Uncharacterized protein n=1 Tax=Acetobacter aceti NBRC 14818 TaxID=887700 RepID=A0AB33IHY6_ACEAC|nr:hypothetical protein [Acetobacter aceti]GBO81280.1 phage-related baseplate assembly protein [Acetobacter aceti NRIC 0242]TCS24735.1 hypothetical protein EDC15_1421 [Acetobacter aceti NBRC 14818]BCK76494.1 hypothetical protein EMQ_2100 [Acetobacter aceti NBRC 14818]BCK77370.1 hypothetical protein EMQ_2976 [Acetobacter aceti NBRC 14818]GAN58945.1 hypothetical protein Abac_135_007 [Acetobacter aceti NBRC 14818]
MSTLEQLATQAGLKDTALLKCARTDLPPVGQIADLKQRYPAAFLAPFDARTATKAEYEARLREMGYRRRSPM